MDIFDSYLLVKSFGLDYTLLIKGEGVGNIKKTSRNLVYRSA